MCLILSYAPLCLFDEILHIIKAQTEVLGRLGKASVVNPSLPERGEESPDSVGYRTI